MFGLITLHCASFVRLSTLHTDNNSVLGNILSYILFKFFFFFYIGLGLNIILQ